LAHPVLAAQLGSCQALLFNFTNHSAPLS
jgi:hypothetical protein